MSKNMVNNICCVVCVVILVLVVVVLVRQNQRSEGFVPTVPMSYSDPNSVVVANSVHSNDDSGTTYTPTWESGVAFNSIETPGAVRTLDKGGYTGADGSDVFHVNSKCKPTPMYLNRNFPRYGSDTRNWVKKCKKLKNVEDCKRGVEFKHRQQHWRRHKRCEWNDKKYKCGNHGPNAPMCIEWV